MAHGNAVGNSDGAEFARRSTDRRNSLLDRLRLAHQRDIAGGGLVPAGGDANERLVDLFPRQTHSVIKGPMWRAIRSFGGMPARQFRLQIGFGVQNLVVRPARRRKTPADLLPRAAGRQKARSLRLYPACLMSRTGMAK